MQPGGALGSAALQLPERAILGVVDNFSLQVPISSPGPFTTPCGRAPTPHRQVAAGLMGPAPPTPSAHAPAGLAFSQELSGRVLKQKGSAGLHPAPPGHLAPLCAHSRGCN